MKPRAVETKVAAAALWLQRQKTLPELAVSAVKQQFQLDAVRACEAVTLSRGLKFRKASE